MADWQAEYQAWLTVSDPAKLRRFADEAERRGVCVRIQPADLRQIADRIEAAESSGPGSEGEHG